LFEDLTDYDKQGVPVPVEEISSGQVSSSTSFSSHDLSGQEVFIEEQEVKNA